MFTKAELIMIKGAFSQKARESREAMQECADHNDDVGIAAYGAFLKTEAALVLKACREIRKCS